MTYGVPKICPKCGSSRVAKERIMGAQTGDWVCGKCGESAQIKRPPEEPKEASEKK